MKKAYQPHPLHSKLTIFYRFLKKYFNKIIISLFGVILLILTLLPSFDYKIGNVFFGGVPSLYNITFAQFFYKAATYPLVFKLPPRYAHYQLSRTYFIQGELYKALEEAKEELVIYPDDGTTYYILGLTYGYLNRNHEAIDAFSKYIEFNPRTWAGRNDKAWLQFRVGDIDGALATIHPVVESFKLTVWVQNTYCALLIAKGKYTEALKACTYAKQAVEKMTPSDWGHAYPGNDPRIYASGLQGTKDSINKNLLIIHEKIGK